jgi:hypothetical protein
MNYFIKAAAIPVIIILCWLFMGCTEQARTKHFGGSTKIEIPADKKFVNITWKGSNSLWILTRNRAPNDTKETFYFTESSSWGMIEGSVVLIEK